MTYSQFQAACGLGSGSSSSSGTSGGPPLSGAALRQQMNQQMVNGVVNAAMQGAINGFINSMQRNAAAEQQQRIAFQQEMERRQREAEEQARIAEQQRIAAMFARLDSELKLSNLPFDLSLKDMDTPGPDDLQIKGADAPGPDDLQVKMGDASATSTAYGLKGLPGIYVGGPAGGSASAQPGANAAASEPGSGATGQGIAGLPGMYLDGAQPNQAPELAQAAQGLPAGPERDLTEDTALHAALQNPALTSATQDPQVATFQKTDLNYQQALQTDTQASQNYTAAQAQVTADQGAIATAKSQLASLQPTVDQQAALTHMLDVAKTDEAASEAAREMFDNANIHLSVSRTQAIGELVTLPQDPNAAPIHLSRNARPILLRPQITGGSPMPSAVAPNPVPTPLPARPAVAQASDRPAQLCTQLTGAQNALRRLMETQKMHNEDLAEWSATVDHASDDAWERGLDMAQDYTGQKLTGYISSQISDSDKDIESLYRQISNEKDPVKVGELQKQWEALDQHKAYLQDALRRARVDRKHLDELTEERHFFKWNKENQGDLNGNLEGVRQIVDNLIGDEAIQHKLGIDDGWSDGIKYGESIVDSGYDILSEVLAAQRIKQLNQNADQFLGAQRTLQGRIESTMAKLNAAKQNAPPGAISCGRSLSER
ncbi:MAG: hypothetical protein ACRD28_04860 [Acidobacteriaceae bacterium]